MCVHLFGATSSPGVATFGLRQIATEQGKSSQVKAINFIRSSFYVDDGVISVPSIPEAISLFEDTKEILQKGGLTCHKVKSNARAFLDAFSDSGLAPMESDEVKTLGVPWNTSQDQLFIPLANIPLQITKRSLLSAISQVYDPLGFTSPISLWGKAILQEMQRQGLDWDEECPKPIIKRVKSLQEFISLNTPVSVERYIGLPHGCDDLEVHIFSDASTIGYAAAAYLRFKDDCGVYKFAFLLGKARVAPLSPTHTVPRLELIAAVLAVSLFIVLSNEMHVDVKIFKFWTDSQIVLSYIKNSHTKFKTFVSNRVSFILSHTKAEMWYHVKGSENPADFGSRGIWSSGWLSGPKFLEQPQTENDGEPFILTANDPEVICNLVQTTVTDSFNLPLLNSWLKTLRLWAWIFRWVHNTSHKINRWKGDLSFPEMQQAQIKLLKAVQ